MDISSKTINLCIQRGIGDENHFKCVNLLDVTSLDDVFPGIYFDLVIASECMYYFTEREHYNLMRKFYHAMSPKGIIYGSYPSYDTLLYRRYTNVEKDDNGMIEVSQSGSIDQCLYVNLPRNIDELRKKYMYFNVIDIIQTNLPLSSDENEVEYHILAQKD